jgi:hypothetical protein
LKQKRPDFKFTLLILSKRAIRNDKLVENLVLWKIIQVSIQTGNWSFRLRNLKHLSFDGPNKNAKCGYLTLFKVSHELQNMLNFNVGIGFLKECKLK